MLCLCALEILFSSEIGCRKKLHPLFPLLQVSIQLLLLEFFVQWECNHWRLFALFLRLYVILGATIQGWHLFYLQSRVASEWNSSGMSNSFPISATYFNAIMFMVAASVVTTILVLNYHHRQADTHEMPEWVSYSCILFLFGLLSFGHLNLVHIFNNRGANPPRYHPWP